MSKALKVVVFLGSVRDNRAADRVGKMVSGRISARGHEVTILDPKEKKLDLLSKAFHHYPDPSQAPPVLVEMDASIRAADAFVVLTPEYNRSIPPALSNILDYFSPKSYAYRPAGIISYSAGGGGTSASLQLRVLLSELGTLVMPISVGITGIFNAVSAEGVPADEKTTASVDGLLNQLEFVAEAMKNQLAANPNPPKVQPYV